MYDHTRRPPEIIRLYCDNRLCVVLLLVEPDAKKGPASSTGAPPQIPPPSSRTPTIPSLSGGGMGGPVMGGGGPQLNEDIKVPDKMVGLSKSTFIFFHFLLVILVENA